MIRQYCFYRQRKSKAASPPLHRRLSMLGLMILWAAMTIMGTDVRAEEKDENTAPAPSPSQNEAGPQENKPARPAFGLSDVEELAEKLASQSYNAPQDNGALKDIPEKVWKLIQFKDEHKLWRNQGLPFEAGFFHPGFIFNNMTPIEIIEGDRVEPFAFNADYFIHPGREALEAAKGGKLNYAGFSLYYPLNELDKMDEVLSFLGATHFRALAKRSQYGLEARGLIINPAKTEGEEFPYFRRFWLVKPAADSVAFAVYALMDSPSLTGAYQFEISPGPSTVMEVKAALFRRNGKDKPLKIGLAPMGSMYLFSEKENCGKSDWRPEIHNSDIFLWTEGDDNWFRRPLANPDRLEISCFDLNEPKGFGLMQQDNNFDHYQDFSTRFDLKPSLWVEPAGDWGPGQLELMEIPANQEIHNNIIAFWSPAEAPLTDKKRFDFAYKMYWMPSGTVPHQLGRAVSTRASRDPETGVQNFIIDFEGGPLNDIPSNNGLASVVSVLPELPVLEKNLVKNPVTGGWRLTFKLKTNENGGLVQSLLSARGERKSLRVKALLKRGENLPEALTETWVYDIPIR